MSKSELEETLLFQIRTLGLPEPEREYRFAARHVGLGPGVRRRLREAGLKDWRFDFAWQGRMLVAAVEGGTWVGGRHTRGTGFEGDCEKHNEAILLGWAVLRFTANMVIDGRAVETIGRALVSPNRKSLAI